MPSALAAPPRPQPATSAESAWFGRRSYGLYLWSVPIALSAPYFFPGIGMSGKLALAAVSVAIAELSWRLIEAPVLQRRFLARLRCLARVRS